MYCEALSSFSIRCLGYEKSYSQIKNIFKCLVGSIAQQSRTYVQITVIENNEKQPIPTFWEGRSSEKYQTSVTQQTLETLIYIFLIIVKSCRLYISLYALEQNTDINIQSSV